MSFNFLSSLLKYSTRNKILILAFHDILSTPDPLQPEAIDIKRFEMLMNWALEHFEIVDLTDALRLQRKQLKPRACITFDDGYKSWITCVLPILSKKKIRATFFVSTNSLTSGSHWHQRIAQIVRTLSESQRDKNILLEINGLRIKLDSVEQQRKSIILMEDWARKLGPKDRDEQLKSLEEFSGGKEQGNCLDFSGLQQLSSDGHSIGAHTKSHPILSRISLEEARREIFESREILFETTRTPIDGFAYPNGRSDVDFDCRHVRLAREANFKYAVTTDKGTVSEKDNRFLLKRFTPWGTKASECTKQSIMINLKSKLGL